MLSYLMQEFPQMAIHSNPDTRCYAPISERDNFISAGKNKVKQLYVMSTAIDNK